MRALSPARIAVIATCAIHVIVAACATSAISNEPVRVDKRIECQGVVRAVEPGWLTVEDPLGRRARFQMQTKESAGLLLRGGADVVRYPCDIQVHMEVPARQLRPGSQIRCLANIHLATRRCQAPVSALELTNVAPTLRWSSTLRSECVLTGKVLSVDHAALHVETLDDGERLRLRLPLTDRAVARLRSSDARWLRPGDQIESLTAVRFDSGEWAAQSLRVKINDYVGRSPPPRHEDYPLPMASPRQIRSAHFLLITDLPQRRAQRLLMSLERIWSKLHKHFRLAPKGWIHCYVIGDMSQWDQSSFDATAWTKIKQGAGVTITERQQDHVRSTVYACDSEKVVWHEVVHAFCAKTFGDTGPTWYAEGLAEWASYDELRERTLPAPRSPTAVVIDPVIADYLRSQSPRTLDSVVAEHQGTGDSWQAYAWRWAACQTLVANPNYSRRFADYGRTLMKGGRMSLDGFWGLDSHRARFEFRQFVQHVGVGYDVALCAWNWDVPFYDLAEGWRMRAVVQARRGWQPSGVRVLEGEGYDYVAQGAWQVDAYRASVSADGAEHGEGKLAAVILDDQLRLHRAFALGRHGAFRSPATGRLYLRCLDGWTQLHDNSGSLTVHLRRRSDDSAATIVQRRAPSDGRRAEQPGVRRPAGNRLRCCVARPFQGHAEANLRGVLEFEVSRTAENPSSALEKRPPSSHNGQRPFCEPFFHHLVSHAVYAQRHSVPSGHRASDWHYWW